MKRKILLSFAFILVLFLSLSLGIFAQEASEITEREEIFSFKGYSLSPDGTSACLGFELNREAKEAYESILGKDVEIGIVVVSYDSLNGNSPIDENGEPIELSSGKVHVLSLNDVQNTSFSYKMVNFVGELASRKYVIAPYLYDGTSVYYYQDGEISDTVTGVSFNDIVKISAHGHDVNTVRGKNATCTESGLTDGKYCSECDLMIVEQHLIPAKGHKEVVIEGKDATCTESGLTEGKYCSACGEILLEQSETEPTHKNEIVPGFAPTCTETGLSDGKKCTVCGEITVAQETIDALGHKEETIAAVPPTCTETGLTEGKKCTVCGEITVAQEIIEPLGHKYENSYTCSVCGYVSAIESTGLSFSYNESTDTYTVTGIGECKDTDIVIPYTYENKPVTSIGKNAFENSDSLTGAVIPDSITSIGNYAFSGCSSLNYNEYDNAYYLGNEQNPYIVLIKAKDISVASCTINENTKFIHSSAFNGCNMLKDVTIPDGVIVIGIHAFKDCTSLASIKFNAIAMEDLTYGNYVFSNAGKNENGIKLTIGKDVTKIPAYLFSSGTYSSNITSVEFEDNSVCASIGRNAFSGCSSLTTVYMSNGISNIGDYAFERCTSLTSIVIPDSVTGIGYFAFSGCNGLKSVTIPKNATSIGIYAFKDCTALEEIKFNAIAMEDLSYGNYVFSDAGKNGNGIKVTIGKDVTKIPAYLFYSGIYSMNITSVEFEKNIVFESIGENAFSGCSSLTSIVMPDRATSIADYAFSGCSGLTSVVIPNGVTSIGDYAFSGCSGLTSITIPESLTHMGMRSYQDCTSLEEIKFNAIAMDDLSYGNYVFSNAGKNGNGIMVTIGKSVTKIPAYLFYPNSYSPKITSVEFEQGSACESIGDYAFSGCVSLMSIILPNGITSIGQLAFADCDSLTSIVIPYSVISIESSAFADCDSLTIFCQAQSQPNGWSSSWNSDCPVVWGYKES